MAESETHINFTAEQKAELKNSAAQKSGAVINLTEEQRKHIERVTGKSVSKLNLTEFDIQKMETAAAYENGGTVIAGSPGNVS